MPPKTKGAKDGPAKAADKENLARAETEILSLQHLLELRSHEVGLAWTCKSVSASQQHTRLGLNGTPNPRISSALIGARSTAKRADVARANGSLQLGH